jgi:hypothetical protein
VILEPLAICAALIVLSLGVALILTGIWFHQALRERERKLLELERRPAAFRRAVNQFDSDLRDLYRNSLPSDRQPAQLRRVK